MIMHVLIIQGLGTNPFNWQDNTAEDLQDKFRVNVVVCLSPDLLTRSPI